MAMDFNPLDLLASTALRDNRNTQPDITGTDLKLSQPDDADAEEEEDGETDDNDDAADTHSCAATNGDVMPCSGCDLEDNTIMGSMKSGKDKQTIGKPVAIIAGDGVFTEKKTQTVEKKTSNGSGLAEEADKHSVKVRARNGGEEHLSVVHEPETKLCNGKIPLILGTVSTMGFPTTCTDTCREDSTETAADTEAISQAANTNSEESRDITLHSCQVDDPCVPEKRLVLDVSTQDQNLVADCLSSEAQAPVDEHSESVLSSETKVSDGVEDSDNKIDQDLQVAVGLCNNCDENSTPSVTILPRVVEDTDARVKTHSAFDQEVCDISGIKDTHPPLDCLDKSSQPPSALPSSPPSIESVALDHCYAASPGKPLHSHRPSMDTPEDSGDAFESADETNSADDIEHRPRSLSVDSEYLHYGIPGMPHELEHIPQTDKASLMSPTPSMDSMSNDSSVSENSNALGQFYSILVPGCPNQALYSPSSTQKLIVGDGLGTVLDQLSSESAKFYHPSPLDGSGCPGPTPKCGKFRIGTFASFSSSNLELDKEVAAAAEMKVRRLKIGIPPEPGMKSAMSSPALASPGSPFPLLQSPGIEWDRSDAGSEIQDDLDSSTTEDKYLSSSFGSDMSGITTIVWNHPVFHDHDYCCKETSERLFGKPVAEVRPMKVGKRKYIKKKDREIVEEKINRKCLFTFLIQTCKS